MQRSKLGKVLDSIKNDYHIQSYIALKKREIDYLDFYGQSITFVAGICRMLILDDLIGESQIKELYDATEEYLNTKSSKRLDALFDEMRKGVEK